MCFRWNNIASINRSRHFNAVIGAHRIDFIPFFVKHLSTGQRGSIFRMSFRQIFDYRIETDGLKYGAHSFLEVRITVISFDLD